MPESRSRRSSRVYGRNVGEAISASTGGVKLMLTERLLPTVPQNFLNVFQPERKLF
jgi:hypothetical protein